MKELRNCPLCSSLFSYSGISSLCPECSAQADLEFDKVRQYIFMHPGSNALEIASATGIKPVNILRLLKDGRLSVV